jgi:tetratricopeptide (TPR) repeat protein
VPLSRRDFLASSALLPVLGALRPDPSFAETVRHTPPYLSLEKFIQPGNDEFPEEKEAARIVGWCEEAFRAAVFKDQPKGHSPWPAQYREVAADLSEAVYNSSDTRIADGWRTWVAANKNIRSARFYCLPKDIVRFEIAAEDEHQRLTYRVGHWKLVWNNGLLTEFTPIEEHVATSASPWFRDVANDSGGQLPAFREQFSRGVPYWRARLDPASGIDIYGSNGISVGDIDNDGVDEVYVCQPGGLPNRLLKFGKDGRLTDITDQWRVGVLDDTSAALFLDLRNTGHQDLVVLRSSGPILFINEGSRYRLQEDAFQFANPPGGGFTGMAAADYDRDGKLDLYLCCYVYFQSEAQYTYASPYHDAQNGPPNFLFQNKLKPDGSGFFVDVTKQTGIDQNNNRFSFAPAWCDFNGDGWPDLFVANDFGRKNLYVNKNGHFEDMAAEAGVEDIGPGMSASWFDYDHDGKPDLYVANMWTAAGQRVTENPHFVPAHEGALENAYHRHTMGNSLYRNLGESGKFEDVTQAEQVNFGRWAWSSGGHDFDNDGNSEIFVTCGMLTNESAADLNSFFWRQVVAKSPVVRKPSEAYENGWNALNQFVRQEYSWNGREPNVFHARRGSRYYDFSGVSGLNHADDSRAFAVLDFDGDGRPDILLKSRLGPQVRVLQNNCARDHHAIAFSLRGTKSNRDAIGARVQVDRQTKWLEAGSGFLSQHSKRLLFGLGSTDRVRRVKITWPSGLEQEFENLSPGNAYYVEEGSNQLRAEPFQKPAVLKAEPTTGDNRLLLQDTWLMQPVPLPEAQRGPGLFVLKEFPASDAKREQLEIFRRYLFDWRTTLKLPFALLLNRDGHVIKVYGRVPSDEAVAADLKLADKAAELSLPFSGVYLKAPYRDFFKFGAAYLWSGYPEQALPYLEQVLRRDAANARVVVLVGEIHLQANRLAQAKTFFDRALAANPGNAEAWAGLGDIAEAENKFEEALSTYRKALNLKPDLLYTLLNAGHCADKLNAPDQAEAFYKQARQLNSESAEAANGLGLALAKQGRTQEADQLFKDAIALKRDYGEAINNLGVLYMQQGKVNEALSAFDYGIKMAPDEDILYLNLGRTYAAQGRFDKAREVMHALLERKPDNATARRALQDLEGR